MSIQPTGPLAGIRVLEFSQIVAGPVAGLNLADLGADVIKVETLRGDSHRYVATTVPGESKMYQGNNRGKRCLSLNLQDRRGLAVIHRLVPSIDAVIVNYRPGVAGRLGIGYETLKELRPDLVYAQLSGFGEGAGGSLGGSDIVAQAYSGLMAMDGKLDEERNPELINIPVSDYAAGLAVAMGICAALFHRQLSGQGQYISSSLLRAGLHLQNRFVMREPVSDATVRDPMVAELREARERGAPFADLLKIRTQGARFAAPFNLYYRAYQASDGTVVLGALTPQNRAAFRKVLGIEGEVSDTPGYNARSDEAIAANREWKEWITARMRTRTVAEWLRAFEEAGAPAARLQFPEEVSDDPLVNAEGIMVELEHSATGSQRVVGPIIGMSETPTGSPRPAPALGEHTAEILREAGATDTEIDELERAGVVNCR
jgi:crotonobetainyl-CoA:carnitine CoA-transferase CaiB-like acyl-CoA transferase